VISRFTASTDPDAAAPASEQQVLTIVQPFTNHNGGQLAFGPDGYLYIGMGDGGSAGDPFNNGQDSLTLPGKMLRVDVSSPAGGPPFLPGIPSLGRSVPSRDMGPGAQESLAVLL